MRVVPTESPAPIAEIRRTPQIGAKNCYDQVKQEKETHSVSAPVPVHTYASSKNSPCQDKIPAPTDRPCSDVLIVIPDRYLSASGDCPVSISVSDSPLFADAKGGNAGPVHREYAAILLSLRILLTSL